MLSLPVEASGSDTAVSAECESQMIKMFVVLHQRKERKKVTTLAVAKQIPQNQTLSPKHIPYSIPKCPHVPNLGDIFKRRSIGSWCNPKLWNLPPKCSKLYLLPM